MHLSAFELHFVMQLYVIFNKGQFSKNEMKNMPSKSSFPSIKHKFQNKLLKSNLVYYFITK